MVDVEFMCQTKLTSCIERNRKEQYVILINSWNIGKEILSKAKDGHDMFRMMMLATLICILKTNDKQCLRTICDLRQMTNKRPDMLFMVYDGWQRNISSYVIDYNGWQSCPIK